MIRRRISPLLQLAPHLEGLSALAAAERLARPTPDLERVIAATGFDRARLVLDAYEERAHPVAERRAAGVFYTPPHVIDAMLDRLPLTGELLDPAAGAGAFVVALARRLGVDALDRISACDIDSAALDAAALALEAALGVEARPAIDRWRRTRAHRLDFLRDPYPGPKPDLVVGNPPYGIDHTPDLGARFPALRGERDLYACFLLRALDVVADDGAVALLVPDTWLTNANAASLREALLARSALARLVDFGKPFTSARDTRVHAVVLRRNALQCEVESERGGGLLPMASVTRDELQAASGRGWFLYRTSDEARACRAIERNATRLGDRFDVVYGLRTGDNGRYVGQGAGAIPLVGGIDLDAYDRRLTPKHLTDASPFTVALAKQQGRWMLGVQRIRTNSKVPWRRWVEAAPVRPEEVGLDSLTLLAERTRGDGLSDPLCALLGVLNSSILNRWYRLTFTDVNVKPLYLAELPLPPLDAALSQLVRRRLDSPGDLALERAIDRLVAHAYGLDEHDVEVLEAAYWADERTRRPLPSLGEARAA